MRKKYLLVFIIFILISFRLFAAADTQTFTPHIEVAPYNGAYGVPMGSPFYTGGTHEDKNAGDFNDSENYSNDEIICIGSVQGLKKSVWEANYGPNTEFEVEVSCPNGFYFVSQSNPAFRRPFELLLVFKQGLVYERSQLIFINTWSDYSLKADTQIDLGVRNLSGGGDISGDPIKIQSWNEKEDDSWDDFFISRYRNQVNSAWCDIILKLPGEILPGTDTLYVEETGMEYPLIEADDYTALVTITFRYGDLSNSISIPFSGYYERDVNNKQEGTCSLLVEPTAEAAHMSITRDRGTWVTVGTLDFLMSTFENAKNTPVIFASSSSDPEDPNASEFRMVHDSVTFNTPLTNTNSIPYTVRIQRTGTNGTAQAIFDGTGNIDDVRNSSTYGIRPEVTPAKIQHAASNMDYYGYEGNIDVMMEAGSNVMLAGRYTGTVYIHVVADDGEGG